MLRHRFSALVALVALSSAACSDDDKKKEIDVDTGLPFDPSADKDSGSMVPGKDAATNLDASVDIDAALGTDGAVAPGPDATLPDGALPATGDASLIGDASLDATTGDAGGCFVVDPRYGCGTATAGGNWISFPDFEVDVVNKTAWTKPVDVVDDDALAAICPTVTAGGFTWFLPQMEDVRKMAAGCAKTVSGGSCQVYRDEVLTSAAGDCTCSGGVGPNNGKFCRPEVAECETLWVWTHTDEEPVYQHWFYDVNTGSIVHEYVRVGIALTAKGRCVHALADSELP